MGSHEDSRSQSSVFAVLLLEKSKVSKVMDTVGRTGGVMVTEAR